MPGSRTAGDTRNADLADGPGARRSASAVAATGADLVPLIGSVSAAQRLGGLRNLAPAVALCWSMLARRDRAPQGRGQEG